MAWRVAGLQKQSLIDYPGKVAAVIFLAGCPWRCHYCHNPHLWDPAANQLPWRGVWRYLWRARRHLDGLVITGGEPTSYPGLPSLLRRCRKLGLPIKLDTNGGNLPLLQKIVEKRLVDFVALDLKAPAAKHERVTGVPIGSVPQAAAYLRGQNLVDYQFRTTLSPFLSLKDLEIMGQTLVCGAKIWQLQQCRCSGTWSIEKVQKIAVTLEKYAQHIVVSGM